MKIRLQVPVKEGRGCFVFGEWQGTIIDTSQEFVVICFDEFGGTVYSNPKTSLLKKYKKICKRLKLKLA